MDKDTRDTVIVIVVAIAIFGGAFGAINIGSGLNQAFTVVESQSMQHDRESQIGIIDTGDMVIVKNKEYLEVQSYVEGYISGYSSFGEYGNVIIYDRGTNLNPVIHRAILWMDYNGDGTWSAPSLKDYPSHLWTSASGSDYNRISGVFTMFDLGYGKKTVSIDMNKIASEEPHSGYLTMGDNVRTNYTFDQGSIAGVPGLITYEKIKSVAWLEIPWVGAVKLILNGKSTIVSDEVPNSIPCLAVSVITMISIMTGMSFAYDYGRYGDYYRFKNRK